MDGKSDRLRPAIPITLALASFLAIALLGPSRADGQTRGGGADKAAELLRRAEAACAAEAYSKGVDLTYKAATAAHGTPARHPVRRKWRPLLRKCYYAWIKKLAADCKPEPDTLDRMKTLVSIAKQARKVAEGAVARRAETQRKTCFLSLGGRLQKHCSQDPGAAAVQLAKRLVKLITPMGARIPKATAARIEAALPFCVKEWLKSAVTRCRAMPTVPVLRELSAIVAEATPETRPSVKQAYEACAKQMGNYAWQLCQRREYRKGRALLKEAIGRYTFFKAQDLAFHKQMKKQFLPRCGTYAATMTANVQALTAGVTLSVAARVEILLARTGLPGRLVGVLRIKPKLVYARSAAGLVLAKLKGGQRFIKAKLNPKSGNVSWWPFGPPTPGVESIQVNRRGRAALVFTDSVIDDLLNSAGVFKAWMSTRSGATRKFRYGGSLGGGRRGTVKGTLTMGRLK